MTCKLSSMYASIIYALSFLGDSLGIPKGELRLDIYKFESNL